MIEAFVGLIGGGKSFNAEARMAEYIASGGVVCTNIQQMLLPWYNYRYADKLKAFKIEDPTNPEDLFQDEEGVYWANARGLKHYLKERYNWDLQEGQIIDLNNDQISGALHEHLPAGTADKPVLVVIDEAVDFFDTDDRSTANKEFLTFLRYSRKLCIDIIMIAQEFTELNKRIRNQVQWVWTFKDLGTERIPVLRMPYPAPYKNNIAGAQWSGRRWGKDSEEPVKVTMRWKDQRIFGCYKTEELFREVKVLRDVKTNFSGSGSLGKGKKKMNKFERLALVASLVFSVLGYFRSGHSGVAEATAAEVKTNVVKQPKTSDLSVEELAEAIRELEEKENPEYLISYCYDDLGRGQIFTDQDVYEPGDIHNGRQILRVVKSGYMYMNEDGQLCTYKFKDKPKTVIDSESEDIEDLRA